MKVEIFVNDDLYRLVKIIARFQGKNFSDVVNEILHKEFERIMEENKNA